MKDALKESCKASDIASTDRDAAVIRKEAGGMRRLAKEMALVLHDHSYTDTIYLDREWSQLVMVRFLAILSRWQARRKIANYLCERITRALIKGPAKNIELDATAVKEAADTKAKLDDFVQESWRDWKAGVKVIHLRYHILYRLLQTGSKIPEWLKEKLIWAESRESLPFTLRHELRALQTEYDALQEIRESITREVAQLYGEIRSARSRVRGAWATRAMGLSTVVDTATASASTVESDMSVHFWEAFLDLAFMAPQLAAVAVAGPVGAAVGGAQVVLRLLRWAKRAWKTASSLDRLLGTIY